MTTIAYAMSVANQLQSEGKLEPAKTILQSILNVKPTDAFALHLSGIIAYQSGKINTGIELIQKAIQSNPEVALFHSNLGEMYRQHSDIELSIQCGQRAVTLDPNSATAHSNLGIAYYDSKQYALAEACHQLALAINPQLACSLNNMGSIYKAYDKTQQAIAFYQAAIAAAPHFIDPLNNLATVYLQQHAFREAYQILNRTILLAPAFADAHCNMGLALLGLDQSDAALIYFEKALQCKLNYVEAYYGIAKVHLYKHDFITAENLTRKALAIDPQRIEFYQLLADNYQEQGQHRQALNILDQALAIDATNHSLYINKGSVLMEMGEISQAEIEFTKITDYATDNHRALAHYSLVQLQKTKADSPNLKALLSIANKPDVASNTLIYLYFALGKCYDDLGEYAKAFVYFTKGCRLKRKNITYDMAAQRAFTKKIHATFTKEKIQSLRAHANPSALPIFIIGMPRSGSTLVEQILASHPEVHGAGELTYLNDLIQCSITRDNTKSYYPDNINYLSATMLETLSDKYLFYLRRISADAMRITDKMPQNYIALGLIHALLPNAKIIHVTRNAIDACLSCYTKLFSHGQLYSYDLTELGEYYNAYARIMQHWRLVLPENAWLEINYETLIQDTEAEIKRLLAYCDLAWDPACLTFYQSKRQVRTASFMQVRQPVYTTSMQRWRRYENELAPLVKILNEGQASNL